MKVVIWHFRDGKPGHESQSEGLIQALAQHHDVEAHAFAARRGPGPWLALARARFPAGDSLAAPDLILGAGHATHASMLAARRARGGRVIVLMKPSLPLACFDLCIVPEHDGVEEAVNVLRTKGVLTRTRPSTAQRPDRGLILVGGPSAHHGWSEELLLAQLETILAREVGTEWRVTTSRRTPRQTTQRLREALAGEARLFAYREVSRTWLAEELALAGSVWVTEDSVSMVYEALTAGAATGVLQVPRRGQGRVALGIGTLERDGTITAYPDWVDGKRLSPPVMAFDEAARCARWIGNRWLHSGSR